MAWEEGEVKKSQQSLEYFSILSLLLNWRVWCILLYPVDPLCLSLELFGSFDPYKTTQTYFTMERMSKSVDNSLFFLCEMFSHFWKRTGIRWRLSWDIRRLACRLSWSHPWTGQGHSAVLPSKSWPKFCH